jgi:hypothetical protein
MLNVIFAMFVTVLSPSHVHVKVDPVPPTFSACEARGGEVYTLSDGSHVCEE